jgi:hypothetical protein
LTVLKVPTTKWSVADLFPLTQFGRLADLNHLNSAWMLAGMQAKTVITENR